MSTHNIHRDAEMFAKTAGPGPWYKDPAVIAAVAAPAAGAAVNAASYGIRRLLDSRKKTRAYKDMLQANRHLRDKPATQSQQYFNTLWRTSPDMAKDPIVAGAFVFGQHGQNDRMFPHAGILPGIQSAAKTQSDLATARGRKTRPNFGQPAQAIVGGIGTAMSSRNAFAAQEKLIENKEQELLKRTRAVQEMEAAYRSKQKRAAGPLHDIGTRLIHDKKFAKRFLQGAPVKERARTVGALLKKRVANPGSLRP
jgi:hypothetical protein